MASRIGIAALVLAGAGLVSFFALAIPASLVAVAATIWLVRGEVPMRPSFALGEWRELTRDVLPFAAIVLFTLVYFRLALIVLSLVSDANQTGYFGASFRVTEVLISVPQLAVAGAFPIFVRAARDDRERLAYGVGRMFHAMAVAGIGLGIVLALGASFIIEVVAGAEFAPGGGRDANPGRHAVRSLPRRDVQLRAPEPAGASRDAAHHGRRARRERGRRRRAGQRPRRARGGAGDDGGRRDRAWWPAGGCWPARAAGRPLAACGPAHRAGGAPGARRVVRADPDVAKAAIAFVIYALLLVVVRAVPEELVGGSSAAARIGRMSRPLRVGLNLVYLVEGSGGTGTYARELIPALLAVEPATRITAFVGRTAPSDVRAAAVGVGGRLGDVRRRLRLRATVEPAA